MVAVSWRLICFVASPIPATAMSTFVRWIFSAFASFLVMKLHMDAESSNARAECVLPFWSPTSRETVSNRTVPWHDCTDRHAWGLGFTDPNFMVVDVDGIGFWFGWFNMIRGCVVVFVDA